MFIAVGRCAEYWKGVYTGLLPCGSENNVVCIKVSKGEHIIIRFIHINYYKYVDWITKYNNKGILSSLIYTGQLLYNIKVDL